MQFDFPHFFAIARLCICKLQTAYQFGQMRGVVGPLETMNKR